MPSFLFKITEYFLDMVFPIRCLGCGRNREDLAAKERWICPDCLARIVLRSEQVCPQCEQESEGGRTHFSCRSETALDGLWAATFYDGLIEKAVHAFKFDFIRDLSHPLSTIIIRSVSEPDEFGDFQDLVLARLAKEEEEGIYLEEEIGAELETVLVPVPLHKKRYAWRGFNQSVLLAQPIGARFDLPVREDFLVRAKNTKPQSKTKDEAERRENIGGAFRCPNPEAVRGKNFILVDDICTTSATLNECASELKRSGAKMIWALVVARR